MLYVTTRNDQDAFTVCHVLKDAQAADGGLFVPFHLPEFSDKELQKFSQLTYGQSIAEIINLFCAANLTGWDVDFSIGRYPVRLQQLAHRIVMAESWHNPEWQYRRVEKTLIEMISSQSYVPGNWLSIVIKMAVLAGIFTNPDELGEGLVDIAVVSGDFTAPVSAVYLRKMGFPIGNIICCCNENNQFWELICNGQLRTDSETINTFVPEADIAMPINLERLIHICGGSSEVADYVHCCESGAAYYPSDSVLQQMRNGLFASVISTGRIESTIPNVYKTHKYVMAPGSALAYSGLMDYRTKTGISRPAIVLCDYSPSCAEETVASAMKISVAELNDLI